MTPDYSIRSDGKDITAGIRDRLIPLSIQDEAGTNAGGKDPTKAEAGTQSRAEDRGRSEAGAHAARQGRGRDSTRADGSRAGRC